MKKTLLFISILFTSFTLFAQTFTSGGIKYTVTSPSTVEVSSNTGFIGNAIILASVTNSSVSYSVTSISNSAFEGCSGLLSVSIPNTVTSIGGSAFSTCSGLVSVSIPNSVISIASAAFAGCTSLTTANIGNSVTSIGTSAFVNCTSLTSLTIPSSVTSIGNNSFSYCTGLTSVTVNWPTPLVINANVFGGVTIAAIPLYVPVGTAGLYASATVWSGFSSFCTTPAPLAPSPQNFCEGYVIYDLSATGTDIKWYAAPTGGTPINPDDFNYFFMPTTLYVSQTIGTCEGPRTPVEVNIGTAQPLAPATQNFCNGATFANIIVTGSNITYYNNIEGFPLPITTVLTTRTYYVTQTINGCESEKLEIEVTVTAPPAAPSATSPQAFFNSATVAQLTTTTGTAIQWYSAATGGSPLSSSTALIDGNTYYASQTTGCESPRKAVLVNINIFKVFYFKANQSDLTVLANWGINADGSGTIPTTFLGNDFKFILTNNQSLTTTLTLGPNTTFQLGEVGLPAVTLTITASGSIVSGTLNITAASSGNNTLTIAGATSPNIGTLAMGANGSTVVYNGNGTAVQQISNAQNYNNLTIDNLNGISALYSINVNGTFWLKNGKFRIGAYSLTLNGGVNTNSNNAIVGSNSSYLVFGMYNAVSANCTFFMDNTTPSTTNLLEQLTVNRTGSVVTMGASLVTNYCNLTNGILALGSNTLTLNRDFTGTFINCLQANGLSNLVIGGSGTMGNLFFDQSIAGISQGTGTANDLTQLLPGTTNRLNNFTLNRSGQTITLGNEMQVSNVLIPTAGTLASNGYLVMLSTAGISSSIGTITAGTSDITGNVNVQSYFTGGAYLTYRGTRMISSPIQEVAFPNNFFRKMRDRFVITGPGGTTNGFDEGGVKQPFATTLLRYVEIGTPTKSYATIKNINEAIIPGKGYFFFYRGNKSNSAFDSPAPSKTNATTGEVFAPVEDWTATYIGSINKGDITVQNLTVTNPATDDYAGFHLLGNPYPATLDFEKFKANNTIVDDFLCIVKKTRDGYAVRSGAYNNNTTNPLAVATTSNITEDLTKIQPGQGFYVKITTPGNVTFKESQKVAGTAPVRLLTINENNLLQKAMPPINKNSSSLNRDKVLRYFIQDTASYEQATIVFGENNDAKFKDYDAAYNGGSILGTSTLTADNKNVCINYMPALNNVQQLKIAVTAIESNNKLKLNFTEISDLLITKNLVLQDNYTNTTTQIDEENAKYNFTIDKNKSATFGNNRFVLLIQQKAIIITDFKATKQNVGNLITWVSTQNTKADSCVLEKSTDGINYYAIHVFKLDGISNPVQNCSYLDVNAIKGINYYRLKLIDKNKKHTRTNVISISYDLEPVNEVIVYPNPVKDNINIFINAVSNYAKSIQIFDLNGKLLKNYSKAAKNNVSYNVSDLSKGVYLIKIKNYTTNKTIYTRKFIKE